MITTDDALKLIKEKGQSENIVKHLLSVGAAMRSLALHFGEDHDRWQLAGIIHDADYNIAPLDRHTYVTLEWFQGQLDPEIEQAVLAHNWVNNGVKPVSRMDWALYSVDNLAGLIIAAALVRPDKKLAGLTVKSILKRFNETSFAKGANRDEIRSCQELSLELPEFIGIALSGIQAIAGELGL
jgi:predicted hydrolase (HD superfamily)